MTVSNWIREIYGKYFPYECRNQVRAYIDSDVLTTCVHSANIW
jgi:hypothetical protein